MLAMHRRLEQPLHDCSWSVARPRCRIRSRLVRMRELQSRIRAIGFSIRDRWGSWREVFSQVDQPSYNFSSTMRIALAALMTVTSALTAQEGTIVYRLGTDTVAVESFTRTP